MRPLPSVSPDWGLRGVSPKCAPTRREDRKRAGSSMAAAQVSATIAPTPGVVISRRVGAGERGEALLDGLIPPRVRADPFAARRSQALRASPQWVRAKA